MEKFFIEIFFLRLLTFNNRLAIIQTKVSLSFKETFESRQRRPSLFIRSRAMKSRALRVQNHILERLGFFSAFWRGEVLKKRVSSCALAFKLTK